MNISELARRLNTSVANLRDKLPKMGFDVGMKAVKVDNVIAQKILTSWKKKLRQLQEEEKKAALERLKEQRKIETGVTKVKLPPIITVREFAALLGLPVSLVIQELMKNGIFASLNERIDFDTCAIVADDLGIEIEADKESEIEEIQTSSEKMKTILEEDAAKETDSESRAPVVVIMGHVDHGKTTLLDTIRDADVAGEESGGITQHIGAYQVQNKDRKITFIDTPGHEAFTAMRSRGAKIADIAILVVAADDSVQPQTIESIKMIQDAGLDMIVAINKIDKDGANIDLVKTDLSNHNLVPEDWGGKTICVPISAKNKTGIDDLLDTILLVADVHEENMMVNPNRQAAGTIIESHIDKNQGPVATVLVQIGTLNQGDYLVIDGTLYGRVRAMKDWHGHDIKTAGPSVPVKIIGLKVAPKVGDVVEASADQKAFKKVKKGKMSSDRPITIVTAQTDDEDEDKNVVNILIKADVLGSLEAIEESLEKISHPELSVKLVSKGLGSITESDILRADATGAWVVSFKVPISSAVEILAKDKSVELDYHEVIFKLLDKVKEKMEAALPPSIKRKDVGRLKVLKIFKKTNSSTVLGGAVEEGELVAGNKVTIKRGDDILTEAKLAKVQFGHNEIKAAKSGQECGLEIEGKDLDIQEEDTIIAFSEEEIKQTLDDFYEKENGSN